MNRRRLLRPRRALRPGLADRALGGATLRRGGTHRRRGRSSNTGGAGGGHPAGDVPIVAFMDYNCPFCKKSSPDLEKFVDARRQGAARLQGMADPRALRPSMARV